ncbi:MAG TPA: DHA2 family efflux MFS transporter permease subunit, partial [Streptosporangiaceae bacterium]
VVTTAIPVIRAHLGASLTSLEWTVNAYTLTFAVLLLTGAALGDRFGRRRLFALGVGTFTAGSVAAALAPSIAVLNLARAVQGLGGSIVLPLTLTILSAAVPASKRGLALGTWGGISGLAVALGPVVGGAIVQASTWQWIFWLNVPIGAALVPLAMSRLTETYGPAGRLDLPGLALSATGLFGIVWGLVRGNTQGWASTDILTALTCGAALLAGFVAWEQHTRHPMLPMRQFRSAPFTLANTASLFMYFGMFGSIFLLAQFFQIVQGYSPLGSGLRILPWTIAPMVISPAAGALSDRVAGRTLIGTGLTLQAAGLAWLGLVATPAMPYAAFAGPFLLAGTGMGLFFAPMANVVLSAVAPSHEGKASGANNAIRELGGVFGVAVLAAVFARFGGYHTGHTFVAGMKPAILLGAAAVAAGAAAAFAIPHGRRVTGTPQPDVAEPAGELTAL